MADNTIELDKIEFKNLPSGNTPVNDENLNLVQENVEKFGNIIAKKAENELSPEKEKIKALETRTKELETINADQEKLLDMFLKDHKPIPFNAVSSHLEDTGELPMPISINGGIEQDTREGYQLVDFDNANNINITSADYTFENDILTVYSTNRPDKNWNCIRCDILEKVNNNKGKTLYFNFEDIDLSKYTSTNSVLVQFYYVLNGTTGSKTLVNTNKEVTPTQITAEGEFTTAQLRIYCNNSSVTDVDSTVKIIKPILSFVENAPYEKYGQSPSLDFPSEVKGVTGRYDTVVGNKNFCSEIEVGNINASGNNFDAENSIRSKNYDLVKPNTTYIASKNGTGAGFNVNEYDSNKTHIARTYYSTGVFTTSKTTRYVKLQILGTLEDTIQLEIGDTATDYTPHQEQLLPLDLKQNFANNYEATLETANISGTGTIAKENGFCLVFFKVLKGNYHIKRKSGVTVTWVLSQSSNIATYGNVITPRTVVSSASELDYEITNDGYLVLRNSDTLSLEEFLNDLDITSDVGYDYTMYSGKPYKENGKLFIPIEWEKLYAKDLSWKMNDYTDGYKQFYATVNNAPLNGSDVYSNHFVRYAGSVSGHYEGNFVYTNYSSSLIVCPAPKDANGNYITDVEAFKSATQNTYFVYKLAKPTREEITDTTLIKQIEAYEKANSYKEVTNINTYKSSEEVADMKVSGNALMSNDIRLAKLEKPTEANTEESA